jgi:predicted nucleic acid-binding protein
MGLPCCLLDPSAVVVADASVLINLNATGHAPQILRALPNPVVLVDIVLAELNRGRANGKADADLTAKLVHAGLAQIVSLGEIGLIQFERLVIGSAAETLDDGEAATVAYATEVDAIVVIDERKANRICATRFPKLAISCSVDILAHPEIQKKLGRDQLSEAVFCALRDARMRVMPHHVEWVVELIGQDLASQCSSLPRSARALQHSTRA